MRITYDTERCLRAVHCSECDGSIPKDTEHLVIITRDDSIHWGSETKARFCRKCIGRAERQVDSRIREIRREFKNALNTLI